MSAYAVSRCSRGARLALLSRLARRSAGERSIRILPGQYYDAETGTHYNYYRDYDPAIGRYEQSDPIRLRGGLNIYEYAYDDPLRYVDANGQDATILPWLPGAGAYPGAVGAISACPMCLVGGAFMGGVAIGSSFYDAYAPEIGDALDNLIFMGKGGKDQGRNWATEEAKVRAKANCTTPCEELAKMLEDAKGSGNTKGIRDIEQAEKFLGCRNKAKRRSHY